MNRGHTPVLVKEAIEYLDPKPGQNFIDATVGSGGHTFEILRRTMPDGKVLAIDLDKKTIDELAAKTKNSPFANRIIFAGDNFANLENILKINNFGPVQGIIADLGLSSMEIEISGRGFSFLKDEALDMRFGESQITAAQILNNWRENELSEIFKNYGEERFAGSIAKKIIEARRVKPITTTWQLAEIIKEATPGWYHHRRINPSTKTFQALRIAVNDELKNLSNFLPQAFDALQSRGKLVVIAFHSLEDRIVKNFYKEKKEQNSAKILTKKVVRSAPDELRENPRSRSAKLRALEKI